MFQSGCFNGFNGVNTPHLGCHDFLLKFAIFGCLILRHTMETNREVFYTCGLQSNPPLLNSTTQKLQKSTGFAWTRTDDIFLCGKSFETNPPTTEPLVTVDLKKTPSLETPSRSRPKVSSIVSHSYWVDPTGRFVQATENRST